MDEENNKRTPLLPAHNNQYVAVKFKRPHRDDEVRRMRRVVNSCTEENNCIFHVAR